MRLTFKSDQIAVFDEVLTERELFSLRAVMEIQELRPYTFSGYRNYSMSADDRPAFKSASTTVSMPDPEPIAIEIDALYLRLDEAIKEAKLTLPSSTCGSSFWVYPQGSGLCYHDDGIYAGSYAFYMHETWSENWGGELLVRDASSLGGQFVLPMPNRLVLIAPNVMHSINPVHARAGDRHRQSVAGFLSFKD